MLYLLSLIRPDRNIFLETLPVCTAAAHGVHDLLPGKTFPYARGAGAGKDLRQGRLKNIAQRDIAFGIQAAGHHCTVHQNGYMVP